MNVYILQRTYNNGVSVVDNVFSSKKKAEDSLNHDISWCDRDGWTVDRSESIYPYTREGKIQGVRITPPSGNVEQSERFFIIKKRVK